MLHKWILHMDNYIKEDMVELLVQEEYAFIIVTNIAKLLFIEQDILAHCWLFGSGWFFAVKGCALYTV